MATELKLYFVENDLRNFVEEHSVNSPFYRNGLESFNRHYINKLALYIDDEYKFTTTLYESHWARLIREHFPEFEEIMGFQI